MRYRQLARVPRGVDTQWGGVAAFTPPQAKKKDRCVIDGRPGVVEDILPNGLYCLRLDDGYTKCVTRDRFTLVQGESDA